jgi:site-specific recombinase XerD
MKKIYVMFYLRKDKTNKKGEAPIYCQLTLEGNRLTFATGEYINASRWKATKRLSNTRLTNEVDIRNELRRIESRVKEIKREIIEAHLEITLDRVLTVLRDGDLNTGTLIQLTDFYIQKLKSMVKTEQRAEGTLERFETVKKLLLEFLNFQYKKSDFEIRRLNLEFIDRFDLYMRNERTCENNSTVKYVQNIRSIIKLGIKHNWLKYDPFINYDGKIVEVDTTYLTLEELALIENKTFDVERLNVVKDMFLLSCYTGYAFCDVTKLTYDDISRHIDSELWIFTDRTKTHIKSDVMLLPPPLSIIEKYKSHPECIASNKILPPRSNQRVNAYLKEIADLCGIKKNLHFYVSRHTFATTMLTLGVPIESVSMMMGHKRLSTTQKYARILNRKVSEDMKRLKETHFTNRITLSQDEAVVKV